MASATPLTKWSNITGQANASCFNALCTPGSNTQSTVEGMPCGHRRAYATQAPNALGATAHTQLVHMNHLRIPADMLDGQPCAWHDTPANVEGPMDVLSPAGRRSASQDAGGPAAVMARWSLFLIAYTLLTAAMTLACVRCGLSALVCCAATGPVGLMLSGTVFVLCLLEVRSPLTSP
jgi:hypothetical protein